MSSITRWQVKLGLLLLWGITILTPLVIAPTSSTYGSNTGWQVTLAYLFLFGGYFPAYFPAGGWFIGPMYVIYIVMFLLFFIIYALQVSKYCVRPTNQRWAIISGLLSLIIPLSIFASGLIVPLEAYLSGIYTGPLPFQFILGLIIMQIANRGIKKPEDEFVEKKPS